MVVAAAAGHARSTPGRRWGLWAVISAEGSAVEVLQCGSTVEAGLAMWKQDLRKRGRHGVWAVGGDGLLLGLWCRRGTAGEGEGALRSRRVGRIAVVVVGHIAGIGEEIEQRWAKRTMLARLAVRGRRLLLALAGAQRSKGRGVGKLVLIRVGGGCLPFCDQRQRPNKVDLY